MREESSTVTLISLMFLAVWLLTAGMMFLSRSTRLWLKDLPLGSPGAPPLPSLAVVVAARNEAAGLKQALASLLAQDYPGLTLVVVNDRSDDGTGALLDEMAVDDPRLRIVHVNELPEGWLGKNHALQVGYEATISRFILFTDADVVFPSPTLLSRAVLHAVENRIDHMTLFPDVPPESFAEKLFLMIFNIAFSVRYPVWAVQARWIPVAMGVGAFNLVRREALSAIGGFDHLRLSIDDDIRLGQALKFAGFVPRVALGKDEVVVKWQTGLWGYIQGLEKNFFASLDFKLLSSVIALVGLTLLTCSGYLFLLAPTPVNIAIGLANTILIGVILHEGAEQTRVPTWFALILPLAGLLLNAAHVNSVFRVLQRDGVVWRSHHYHLGELRNHVRERNRWMRHLWKTRSPG